MPYLPDLRSILRAVLRVTLLTLCGHAMASAAAQPPPRPPCDDTAPYPAWPDASGTLTIAFWDEQQLPGPWQPPACTGWQAKDFSVLLAAAGRFSAPAGAPGILQRLVRVSSLAGLRYWSVSRDRWTILIEQAHALDGPDKSARRQDFDIRELQPGREYFYWQQEPTTSGSAIYAFRLLDYSPRRLVVSMHNATTSRRLGVPLLAAGKAESLYMFEQLAGDQWGYYQLTRLGHGPHDWLPVTRASYANRASALFRHIAGLPEAALPVWKGDQ